MFFPAQSTHKTPLQAQKFLKLRCEVESYIWELLLRKS